MLAGSEMGGPFFYRNFKRKDRTSFRTPQVFKAGVLETRTSVWHYEELRTQLGRQDAKRPTTRGWFHVTDVALSVLLVFCLFGPQWGRKRDALVAKCQVCTMSYTSCNVSVSPRSTRALRHSACPNAWNPLGLQWAFPASAGLFCAGKHSTNNWKSEMKSSYTKYQPKSFYC